MSHAKRMLIEAQRHTTEAICFECGFSNRSNFFRHFRRIVGCTPIQYKQQYKVISQHLDNSTIDACKENDRTLT
ncbi:helix-turn-helix domain-containing protein [Parapedobacter sp. 10938]|uniref:helix-turn-helix domain-containing protein n=1 Tax=Parapedobacter flavus TaxID=3110225 RepID=UPI002DBCA098|nr:helix-turn-helix domain-containing protein [Parapedobacter sp. 10938]MEC3878130.1 helix-turn-helix domain-containing protein [Parapedobacter sp. 10938]